MALTLIITGGEIWFYNDTEYISFHLNRPTNHKSLKEKKM